MHDSHLIVVLDDDTGVLKRTERTLKFYNFNNIKITDNVDELWEILKIEKVFVLILDLLMPKVDGFTVLEKMVTEYPSVFVIVSTAVDEIDTAVRCMQTGAFDYVPKTAESARLIASINHAIQIESLISDNRALKDTLLSKNEIDPEIFGHIITQDPVMLKIFQYILNVSKTDKAILVNGESGTGKELIAQAIHKASGRKGELVTVNIAGLDDTLFSDTLFGHKKGAYSGAGTDRAGLIEKATGGTLFLDEIGDLSMQSQVKLLRLVEQKKYYPLGSDAQKATDALIVTATHKDLKAAVLNGTYRADLYYRLEAHNIVLPPLRERKGDIPYLVKHFVMRACKNFNKKITRIPQEVYTLLNNYSFPGNIRELEGIISDAVSRLEGQVLTLDSIAAKIRNNTVPLIQNHTLDDIFSSLEMLPTIEEAEEALIAEALRRYNNNQGLAAQVLGLSRSALNRRVNKT